MSGFAVDPCDKCEEVLQPFLDRDLNEEERALAEEHLNLCEYCRKRYRFEEELRRFVRQARRAGRLVGLAGALRIEHLPQLKRLAPDFAGFRSAVCSGARTSELVPAKVRALRARLREQAAESVVQPG